MNFEEAMKKFDGHGLDAVVLMPRVHDSTVLARIFRRDYSRGGFSHSAEELHSLQLHALGNNAILRVKGQII